MGAHPSARSNTALVAEEQVKCYELRLEGKSIRAIAAIIGVSPATVQNRIDAEIKERVIPLADEVRKMQLDRISIAMDTAMEIVKSGADPELKLKALDRLLRFDERLARLMGIDTPVSQEVVVREGYSEQEMELQQLLAQTQQRNETIAAELNGVTT